MIEFKNENSKKIKKKIIIEVFNNIREFPESKDKNLQMGRVYLLVVHIVYISSYE